MLMFNNLQIAEQIGAAMKCEYAIYASAIIMSVMLLFGCVGQWQAHGENDRQELGENAGQKLVVLVSIPPQQEFVEAIAGDEVEVVLLVPPGADPHTYEPTPSQLAKISQADIYLALGSGIEVETVWLGKIKSLNSKMEIVDTHKGIELIGMQAHGHEETGAHEEENENGEHDEAHAGLDPHIWTSIKNAKIIVQNSQDAIMQKDAKNSQEYEKNTREYLQKLDELDLQVAKTLQTHEGETFFVFHPAWGYFAKDYGLKQEAIEELGKEPTPAQIAYIVQKADEDGVKVIFASPQFSTSSAQVVAEQIGGEVVLISPLDEKYLENSQKVAQSIALALGGENPDGS